MNFKYFVSILAAGLLTAGCHTAMAQNMQSVTHSSVHDDLLAMQSNFESQINLQETTDYIDNHFLEEEEPEEDIYSIGWDSGLVNSYRNVDVPDRKVIDVTNFCMPHHGYVTSPYGYRPRFRRMHKGIDLKVQIGDTIRSAFDGKVRITKYERRGYGYYVVIRHDNGLETVYGHLSRFLVKQDEFVKAGQPIALGGNTGHSTGSHLHFETRFMGYAINPSAIFDFDNQTTHTDQYTFDKKTYEVGRDYSPKAQRARYASTLKSNKYKTGGSKATYRVRKGDTLGKIASRHGVSVKKLCRLNGIKTTTKLKIGKTLRVR